MSTENETPTEPSVLVCTVTLYPDETVGCELEAHHLPPSARHLGRMFAMAHENLGEVQGRLLGSGDSAGAGFTIPPGAYPTAGKRQNT